MSHIKKRTTATPKKKSRTKKTSSGPVSTLGQTFDPIPCEDVVLDVAFHPRIVTGNNNKHTLCAALVTGDVQVFECLSFGQFNNVGVIRNLYPPNFSCRTICFDHEGRMLYTGGENGSLHGLDATRGVSIWSVVGAHDSAVNRVSSAVSEIHGPWALLSGDENGDVKLWDTRQRGQLPVAKCIQAHDDFISDFVALESRMHVVTASGDGSMNVLDVRNLQSVVQSEELDTELMSLVKVKDGTRLVTGTQDGALNFWSTAQDGLAIGNGPIDGFTGHPHSVDCILKLNEDIILTGSSDGMIRAVQLLPNKLLGVIGYHDDFPVERMSWSSDKMAVATCSHDELVRIWDTAMFGEMMLDGDSKMNEDDMEVSEEDNNDDAIDDDDDENGQDETDAGTFFHGL